MYKDWRILTLLSILFWGLWGFLSKYVSDKVQWGEILMLLMIGTFIVAMITSPASLLIKLNFYSVIALISGISCAFGYYFFYRALVYGQASSVVPISSMYIVVTAVLAIIFMHEPLTAKKLFGILSAVIAIVLRS